MNESDKPGNTKGGSITVPLTSRLTGLELVIGELTIFVFICKTDKSKPVKQEVNGTVILPPLVFPGQTLQLIVVRNCFAGKKFNIRDRRVKMGELRLTFKLGS